MTCRKPVPAFGIMLRLSAPCCPRAAPSRPTAWRTANSDRAPCCRAAPRSSPRSRSGRLSSPRSRSRSRRGPRSAAILARRPVAALRTACSGRPAGRGRSGRGWPIRPRLASLDLGFDGLRLRQPCRRHPCARRDRGGGDADGRDVPCARHRLAAWRRRRRPVHRRPQPRAFRPRAGLRASRPGVRDGGGGRAARRREGGARPADGRAATPRSSPARRASRRPLQPERARLQRRRIRRSATATGLPAAAPPDCRPEHRSFGRWRLRRRLDRRVFDRLGVGRQRRRVLAVSAAAASGAASARCFRRQRQSRSARPWLPASADVAAGFRLRRFRPLLHAIAERAQDRGEVLARRAGERRHRAGDGEAEAVERAGRLHAGRRPRARPAPAGSDRRAAPGCRRGSRARRTPDSRWCGRAASACPCRPGSRCGRSKRAAAIRRGPCRPGCRA